MTMEVSAEVHFAQTLASNDKKFRDRALKRLKKYISVRSSNGEGLRHDDYIKLWKGLHYCMWMQDKPLIQEELSQKMVSLLNAFPKLQDALSFVNVFFITEAREWTCIDRLRLDKFMLLIREMLHKTFELLSRSGWPLTECQSFSQNLTAVVMKEDSVKIPYGIKMHLADIYLVELRKVSFDGMTAKKLSILMFPFIYFLLKSKRRELSQVVYNKTLRVVLQEFGVWSWQGDKGRSRKSKAKKKAGEPEDGGDDSGEERDDDDEMDVSDQDDNVEEEEDEDDESNDDDEEEEEVEEEDEDVDMEIEEEKDNTTKRKKYDLSTMLKLMHRLAQDPKVEIRNRRYVYGIVNNFATKDPEILKSSPGNFQSDSDDGDIDISSVVQLTGETEEEDSDNRKRRRKRNRKLRREEEKKEEEEGMEEEESESQKPYNNKKINNVVTDRVGKNVTSPNSSNQHEKEKDRKKKKRKMSNEKNETEADLPKNKSVELLAGNKGSNLKENVELGNKGKNECVVEAAATLAKTSKKRKRISSGTEDDSSPGILGFKKMKVGDNVNGDGEEDLEKVVGKKTPKKSPAKIDVNSDKKKKENSSKSPIRQTSDLKGHDPSSPPAQKNKKAALKEREESNNNKNNNSNANSKGRSPLMDKIKNKKLVSLTSPVECVIYKQKSPTVKPGSINKLSSTITSPTTPATTKFIVSDSSPSRSGPSDIGQKTEAYQSSSNCPCSSDASSQSGDVPAGVLPTSGTEKGEKSKSPNVAQKSPPRSKKSKQSPETTDDDEKEDSGVMGSLYNVMSTPCHMIKKAVGMVAPATDPGAAREKTVVIPDQWTPGQKKVVFDLRRNKANKFQDYLKTLANDPSPAFEPGKSPGQGILKSPSVESCLSSQDTSLSSNSTPNMRRKKGKGLASKRKPRSPILRF